MRPDEPAKLRRELDWLKREHPHLTALASAAESHLDAARRAAPASFSLTSSELESAEQWFAAFAASHPMGVTCLDLATNLIGYIRELEEDRRRLMAGEPHPSHKWSGTILNRCVACGAYKTGLESLARCDPFVLAGKTEYCCGCTEEYPASELIAGHIYCERCRAPREPD